MQLGTFLHTLLFGRLVGSDELGNRYYEDKRSPKISRGSMYGGNYVPVGMQRKRWVYYNGLAEASKVPPHWHGWLHYTRDAAPVNEVPKTYAWQQDPLPNLTGTDYAYRPSGHILKGGNRAPSTSDYEAWRPE